MMKKDKFKLLKRGDLVRHVNDPRIFIVSANYDGRMTAITSVDMTNPSEWELISEVIYK